MSDERFRMAVAVYGILRRDDEILLLRRAGSGYHDGELGLPAGHLDGGEDAVAGLVRELREELMIEADRDSCRLATALHRAPEYDGDYEMVDLVFDVPHWTGTPGIGEPGKCSELIWARPDDLPADVIAYVRRAIEAADAGEPLVLLGWTPDVFVSLTAEPIESERLVLTPLRVADADELAPVLDDAGLHTFIGGTPASMDELRDRYRLQVLGRSPDRSQRWLNWVVRTPDGPAMGTVQATVIEESGVLVAEVAWVIGTAHQGNAYATEAAGAMARWLRDNGAGRLVAHIHPAHHASAGVARAIGLRPTDVLVDGEVRWEG